MDSKTHDPSEYIKGLQQILVSDKKRIGFLFGAGTSLAKKNKHSLTVPAIAELTEKIVKEISDEGDKLKKALLEIKSELGDDFNIESLLSNLEQKHQIIGQGTLNKLNKKDINDLIKKIKGKIVEKASVHNNVTDEIIKELVQTDFAEWIGQANRKFGIEIFTTNFDYLFELALEYKNIPYYDGFAGSYEAFFYSESVEDFSYLPQQVKLWKIHGSLGWYLDTKRSKVIKKSSEDESNVIIFPSYLKYSNSKKQPYFSFLDRLYNFLRQDDSILITCGYSFNDEHINERIISALNSDTTSHVIALYYGNITNVTTIYRLANNNSKFSAYGFKNAVIGCQFGDWKLKNKPSQEEKILINTYFDENVSINDDDELSIEEKGKKEWSGKGKFKLPDFQNLTIFLKSMIAPNF